ncbi:Vacuolar protein sorting-associated protein 13A N-terminal domain protein [Kalmanozyma brasiliensis GHG001]|uniref:Vacuolar protein sorting-associated protein n=1 Tax=Kalmanozyma brasiliensis (strain GHG001) TaxID=1365824 RepID=V5EKX9_KALBG|nr:Vacuolar protein sorting-associated protein 13A N-terminal domain protein [Kalmanozyma brasiliensis GHG001]EST05630.1 Vacuolar protein sorting-associated protein 13A N-terminal domain protein [Kalmanozyma brasiliensis GHG001]
MLEGVLATVLNRVLAAYVDGLNTSQLNVGIWSGDVKLRNLRLKTSALDKFRLPIDVKEGYLGDLTLSIPWSNLKGKPVRILVENVYLLAAPKNSSVEVDEEEEAQRAQAAKQEKLANAELLGSGQGVGMSSEDEQKNQSFTSSLITKIVDNLQFTVRNIHIRYEDSLSNPEHPFSAGITLAEFSAVSTDANWNPTFIQNSGDGIHKLARLESLSVYWDTDSESLAGHEISEAQKKFSALIARDGATPSHQYILKPVSGAGRLVMRKKMTSEVPKMDAQLLFEELGFALDDEQYRDVISVADLFHFYTRQAQYRRFRPTPQQLEENRPRALLRFAGNAILNEVHERHRVWTWDYFRQRRDDRKEYVELFKQKERSVQKANQNQAGVAIAQSDSGSRLEELEKKLDYKDIRFYRSIARHDLRKERLAAKKEDLDHGGTGNDGHNKRNSGGGWLGWIWGGGGHQQHQDQENGVLNEQQRKELYDAIEWDEEASATSLTQAVDAPRDAMHLRLITKLKTGSVALKDHARGTDILSLVFDSLQANVIQRHENLEAAVALGGLRVYDGTTPNSLYPQVVRVKDEEFDNPSRQNSNGGDLKRIEQEVEEESDPDNPFFYAKYELKPLDDRADNALTLKMRSMEIIYHRGLVESIVRFFKPPESELELIGALIDVASETIEGIRKETRAGLENALQNHKTIDMVVDIKAPIIIVPEDVTTKKCQHMVLDAGRIAVRSVLADQKALDTVRSKQNHAYTAEDYRQLEDLMYDRFFVKLESAQLVMGNDIDSCMKGLHSNSTDHGLHLLERINLDFTVHNSILASAPNLTKFKITGHLPTLRVNFSDRKYKTLMRIIEVAIPNFDDATDSSPTSGLGAIEEELEPVAISRSRQNDDAEDDNDGDDGDDDKDTADSKSRRARGRPSETLDLNKARRQRLAGQLRGEDEYIVDAGPDEDDGKDEFQDAEDPTVDKINAHQKTFELEFVVDSLQGSIYRSATDPSQPDRLLVDARFEGFLLHLAVYPYHMDVDVGLRSLELEDKIVDQGAQFRHLITSKHVRDSMTRSATGDSTASSGAASPSEQRDLVRVRYTRVSPESPEFMTKYEGIDQTVNVELSTINVMLTRVSVLAVYDWIMTTFVSVDEPSPSSQSSEEQQQRRPSRSSERRPSDATSRGPSIRPSESNANMQAVTSGGDSERKEKLRVRVKLNSIVLRLNNDGSLLATLTLSTADVAVMLRGNTIRVAARLGSLLLYDNAKRSVADPHFKKLLSIQGDELADFTYETFDEADEASYPGYDSSIWLRSGSLKFTFVEEPIRDLLQFFSKFAQMKAVYDAATLAASNQASQLQERVDKMHYDILVKTPIVVLPRSADSTDVMTANLGEIYAKNTFAIRDNKEAITKIEAGLRHIRLASRLRYGSQEYHVQMIDDVNISLDMIQSDRASAPAGTASDSPETQMVAKMSDVHIKLTEAQYCFVMELTQSIPRAFAGLAEEATESDDGSTAVSSPVTASQPAPSTTATKSRSASGQLPSTPSQGKPASGAPGKAGDAATPPKKGPGVDMLPELGTVVHTEDGDTPVYTSLDMFFDVNSIQLELFTSAATGQETLYNAQLARFSINGSEVKLKMLSDSSMEAEVALKTFTVTDQRPDKDTKFREIVPAVKHDGHQFMMSYSVSGGDDGSALALITVDSPKVIFSLDPVFALLNFFMSAFPDTPPADENTERAMAGNAVSAAPPPATSTKQDADPNAPKPPAAAAAGTLAFRVNVVDPTIILLAAPERHDTEAIVLSIKQVLMSQQGIMALKVDQFGMFMCRMHRPKDTLRLLDNFDLAMSMDSRISETSSLTSIEVDVEPLVLRVSIRDILMIQSVVNKAIELSSQQSSAAAAAGSGQSDAKSIASSQRRQASMASTSNTIDSLTTKPVKPTLDDTSSTSEGKRPQRIEDAELVMAKESLRADFAGLQIILISDAHSLPMLDLNVSKFAVDVRDWSGDMHASTFVDLYINYYNLSRSHWEPLIDPWGVQFHMETSTAPSRFNATISSKKRLELNITTTLIETGLAAMNLINEVDLQDLQQRNRAPFVVQNRTGYRISLWPEHGDRERKSKPSAQHLDDGQDMPWRFDDWKSMRENIHESGSNRLSLQIDGMPWERLRHISVDREGEYMLTLRPKLDKVAHRVQYEVKLQNNVKYITFRSSFKIENKTLIPVEMVILDHEGNVTDQIRRIGPGEDCPVPIEAAYHCRVKIRPDPGFEYDWCQESLNWQDLVKKSTWTLTCRAHDASEAPFRFQSFAIYDRQDPNSRTYPRLTLRLRAPVEVENLLPYDIQYRIFDKNLNHNWSSYLRKGGISPIHVVEISHLLLLSVDIQSSCFSPSEFAIIATDNPDDFPVEKVMTLADAENLKLNLRLHYSKHPDSGGAFKVQIYSPYIFINQSGLPFALKTKSWLGSAKLVAGQDQTGISAETRKTPEPFLFSHNSNDRRNRVLMRVGDSQWSKPLSFEAIGSETEVVIPSASRNEEIHVGLTVEDGLGKFKLSKVVKLTPRYLVRNNLTEPLNLREAGAADFVSVEPGQRVPLHFLRVGATRQMTLAYPGINNKWTAPFNIEDIGSVFLRIAKTGQHQHLIKAEVLLEGPTIFISLSLEEGPWPYMLRNESDYTVQFMQATERVDESGSGRSIDETVGKRYELKPRSKMKYAWDYPAAPNKMIKLVVHGRERNVNILEIGSLLPFKFPAPDGGGVRVMAIDVRADGPQQTLVLSNYKEEYSNFKLKRQNSTFSRSDTVSSVNSKDAGFVAVDVDTNILTAYNLEFEGVGISLINQNIQELAYVSFRGLELHYTESEVTTAVNVICKWIQIDNQLFGGLFPIVLYPTVLPKDGKDLEVHPTLQASVIMLKDETHGVTHIKYASVLLQEITAELDEDFLFALYEFSKFEGAAWQLEAEKETDFIEHPREVPEPSGLQSQSDDIYFEILHLQPISLNLSFMRTERVNGDDKVSSRNPLIFLFNALTMALGNVNEAPVRLNALVIENVRLSTAVLQQRIVYHYTQGFLLQLYRVLGSADFLGNPVGLFNNVSSGVADIFYEPYQGLVMHGNRELGLGIARGASSFVKKTVFGLTDSVSKVTGSIGKGLAAATMDKEFQSRRRMTRFRNKPRHALYGITAGANSFFTSVASGFEGLALRPLEGAERGGAGGFLKGVGKGLVGAITKPAVGVFDLASNVTEGVRNTTMVFDQNDIDRVRLPRYIAADGIVRPYSDREALGQTWLKNVDNGRLMKDSYVAHVDVGSQEGDAVIMLTVSRILYIRTMRLKVMWEVPLSDLSSISLEKEGIALVLRGGVSGPFLHLPDVSTRNWLFKQISKVVQAYNASRQS